MFVIYIIFLDHAKRSWFYKIIAFVILVVINPDFPSHNHSWLYKWKVYDFDISNTKFIYIIFSIVNT